jgi:hypothetical protein
VAAVGCPQVGREEGFDWLADQFGMLIAKHLLQPTVG